MNEQSGINNSVRRVPPSPVQAEPATSCVQQVADAVLQLNRELVAQNIWLREQLTADLGKKSEVAGADEELKFENERLRQQVQELEKKLEKKQEIALLSAKVVDSRITYRDNQQFVEYKLQIETDSRGTLFVWHRYSTFRNLAEVMQTKQGHPRKRVPELPSKQLFGNFSEKIIQDRVAKLNQFLDAATSGDHLQWGIRVDADTCVYKRRRRPAISASSWLRTKDWALPSRKSDAHQDALVVSAKIEDSRTQSRAERPFIEYQLRLKTDTNNTLLVWHRYSALYDWAKTENPSRKIPQLPKEEPFGSFSKHTKDQTAALNVFFKKIVKANDLDWVARVHGKEFVCKLRVKDAASPSSELELSNPLASVSKLFPLKQLVQRQRQRKRSDVQLFERKMAQAS